MAALPWWPRAQKAPTSNFRPVLLPLQICTRAQSAWGPPAEIAPQGGGMGGRPCHAHGEALLSGLYTNELLLRLLARDDPSVYSFDHYADRGVLATEHGESLRTALRSFELLLLREVGDLLPALHMQTLTLQRPGAPGIRPGPEGGLAPGQQPMTACRGPAVEHNCKPRCMMPPFTILLRQRRGDR